MNLLDVLALVVLAASAAAAALKGWIREGVSLAAVLLGVFPAFRYCDLPGGVFRALGLPSLTADVVGAFLILIVFMAAGSALSGPVAVRWAGESGPAQPRWLGVALGVLRGYVLIVIALTLLAVYPAGILALRQSLFSGVFLALAPAVAVMGGGELGPALGLSMDRLHDTREELP